MGAIAGAIVAYAQPLFEQSGGDPTDMERAMLLAQLCWNLALLPEGQQDAAIDELRPSLEMADEEFADFRQQVVVPMIQRHREMFPELHKRSKQTSNSVGVVASPSKKHPGAGRNAPCPCGSGRKYKACCGAHR